MRTGLKTTLPPDATKLGTYRELGEIVGSFAEGKIPLLVILGSPGLSKSQTLKLATKEKDALLVKGHRSPMKFYEACYYAKDRPIVIDDANEFMEQKLNQQFVRSLTETDAYKRMEYDSTSKAFEAMGIPSHFYTTSPVCIISNWWADTPLFRALESRAEFFNFAPSWFELHREVGTWFWDQEIYDYVGKNLHKLRSPDARLYVKAANRKEAGLSANPWKSLIDSAHDDAEGQRVRELLADKKIRTNDQRAKLFVEEGFGSRATFYRRMAEIRAWLPESGEVPVNKLKLKERPKAERPHDAVVPDSDDDE